MQCAQYIRDTIDELRTGVGGAATVLCERLLGGEVSEAKIGQHHSLPICSDKHVLELDIAMHHAFGVHVPKMSKASVMG